MPFCFTRSRRELCMSDLAIRTCLKCHRQYCSAGSACHLPNDDRSTPAYITLLFLRPTIDSQRSRQTVDVRLMNMGVVVVPTRCSLRNDVIKRAHVICLSRKVTPATQQLPLYTVDCKHVVIRIDVTVLYSCLTSPHRRPHRPARRRCTN